MVNFCVFSLLLSYAPQEPSGNISLWSPPPGKLGKLIPLPPGKSDPFRWGGVWIFSGTTQCEYAAVSTSVEYSHWKETEALQSLMR